MSECPKCGASVVESGSIFFECGTYTSRAGIWENPDCLRTQLAQANERIAELEQEWDVLSGALCMASLKAARYPGDWSQDHRLAWIYGLLCGWDDESLSEIAKRHNWEQGLVDNLRRYRKAVDDLLPNSENLKRINREYRQAMSSYWDETDQHRDFGRGEGGDDDE
ncbi:MAG TPA: hypothetical protein VK054_06960 [Beutenbergiaceae bacterium]|nr:hypothetical protein [Beutenbergiaceae bacterium]